MERPTIQQQIDEVRGCFVSIRSAVEAWQRAPERHRSVETGACRSKLGPLEAAVRTLEWVRDNAEQLRQRSEAASNDTAPAK
ncbi:hypothetical protein MMB17_07345 [Methylobacterium organophilum]|uniref:hypothetical protein n=1 Tax=Methylobacterium organophilum TaxID=410 RepID=UPI001F12C003|nr:hypothetical protein [Methylobacterium organophilum]UMY19104.1 hypothetical protein MMB17_07345 [Methylobacterium organophilum]